MRILNRLGGIELSSAYVCIKAISKKKHEIIDQRRAEFLAGAQERGVPESTAREIFGLITFFWDDPQPYAKLEIRDGANVVRIVEKVNLTNVGSH